MSEEKPNKIFVEKFNELSDLYSDVKEKIILAEEVYDKFPATLTNEVRNSYDHIFRIFFNGNISNIDEVEKQFISASRHLKRAGYDACELIVGGYVAKTNEILHKYTFEELNITLGAKYSEIKIFLNDVSSQYLVEARSKKNLKTHIESDIEIDDLYPQFALIISKVVDIWKEATNYEPLLEECRNNLKQKSKKDTRKQYIIGISIFLITSLLTYLVTIATNNFSNDKTLTTPKVDEQNIIIKKDSV